MIKCPACKELISHSSLSYKVSAGFLNTDGTFQEDTMVIIHAECVNDYSFNPVIALEKKLKDGEF